MIFGNAEDCLNLVVILPDYSVDRFIFREGSALFLTALTLFLTASFMSFISLSWSICFCLTESDASLFLLPSDKMSVLF